MKEQPVEDLEKLRKERIALEKELAEENAILSEKLKMEELKTKLRKLHPPKAVALMRKTALPILQALKESKARSKRRLKEV